MDTETHNGFTNYYSVVARDHRLAWDGGRFVIGGMGTEGDPSSYFHAARSRPDAQTVGERQEMGVNIYVYPNPATRESLAEFQSREPSREDPTGVRVMFNNLPFARNVIRIYTIAGDLIQTIEHDGTTQGGAISWNLMTRNRQEIVSGIYLYSVDSDDDGFARFNGRFVVVR